MEKLLLYLMAIVPGIAMAIYIYFMDKDEPEPIKLVVLSFLIGFLSFGISLFLGKSVDFLGVSSMSLVAKACIEELSLFILIWGILYHNKNFNEPLDGIVYSVLVAMGFVTLKNLMHAYSGTDTSLILPMLTNILAYASFAALMGYLLGKAKFTKSNAIGYGIAALVLAIVFHILYDFFQFFSAESGMWIGSVVALVVLVYLGKQALDLHQKASPFKK